jgi:ribosomal protein S18 acetylase RimI-like enzyme
MMTQMELLVRPATATDRAAGLLYQSARPYYDAFAGRESRARRLLSAVWAERAHAASWQVCAVAESAGEVIGVLAGYPVSDADRLARRFLRLAMVRMPPWQWPTVVRHLQAASRMSPRAPAGAFYVDALAVAPAWQRRGVARSLLAEADRRAAAAGLAGVALDTGVDNAPARALYEGSGFALGEVRMAGDPATARAVGGPGFAAYFRPLS